MNELCALCISATHWGPWLNWQGGSLYILGRRFLRE